MVLHAPQLSPHRRRDPLPHFSNLIASMAAIADRAVIADIETEGVRVGQRKARCYDIRPMLDEREHSPQSIDMASEALAYAIARGIVAFDQGEPWLARVVVA